MFALAAAATVDEMRGTSWLGEALAELGIGALVGTAIGFPGGWLLRWARDPGWVAEDFAGIAVLALALLAYTAVLRVHGNGFVAAFYAGLAFGASAGRRGPTELVFLEQLTSLLVWLAFGALVIPVVADAVDLVVALYAILSLTLLRMCPSPWPASVPASTATPWSSSGGSARGGSPRSSSHCSLWNNSGPPPTVQSRSSAAPCS